MNELTRKTEKEDEHKKAKDITLSMLQDGMCFGTITKYTGLSKEEVQNLNKSHICNH
jgi:beta-N-acetylglucosaminidase